ncbi:MAG: AAA family ATPase [Owenweeksia sp.]|nr:AAA family ATPase [Owenweeksia sp.]
MPINIRKWESHNSYFRCMLQQLSVKNYALIDQLDLELNRGLSVITGETGAGKSIILGALGLILGRRADLKSLRNPEKKCVVEGSFKLDEARFSSFFEAHDLDFEQPCIFRREISPSGKSRAFINDTPVTLHILNGLSEQIIDVHSQHDTLLLTDNSFQLQLLNSYAGNENFLNAYREVYQNWKELKLKINDFDQNIDLEVKDFDYIKFLSKELQEAKLEPTEQENIEEELRLLENSEEIAENLEAAIMAIEDTEGAGVNPKLREIMQALRSLGGYHDDYSSLAERVESVRIEMDDIRQELEDRSESADSDPRGWNNWMAA